MKLLYTITFSLLHSSTLAWKPFSASEKAPALINENHPVAELPLDLNLSEILKTSRPPPKFYAAAMLEIKRLDEKPICHRMAAQLLVKNCQGMRDLGVHEYQTASDKMQRHHVESFAASLAMCDMDRARFDIPGACRPFRSDALEDAIRGTEKLDVSAEDVSRCLEGLGQDHSHWSTWLSYRDTSLLLCRGASVDVGKDQAMKFHKKFVQMMEDFTTDLHNDMLHLRKQMADYNQESRATFEDIAKQTEIWRTKVHASFETVSEDLMGTSSTLKSILVGTNDASRMIRNIVGTLIHSNAELAAEQERAISIASTNLKSSFGGINELAVDSEVKLEHIQNTIGQLATAISALIDRHNAIEKSSQSTLSALINATELVESHEQRLDQASHKASKISEALDRVATNALKLSTPKSSLDWVIRTTMPIITLLGGNFKTDASTANNLLLLTLGYCIGESMNILRHWDWTQGSSWPVEWFAQFFTASNTALRFTNESIYQGGTEEAESSHINFETPADSNDNLEILR